MGMDVFSLFKWAAITCETVSVHKHDMRGYICNISDISGWICMIHFIKTGMFKTKGAFTPTLFGSNHLTHQFSPYQNNSCETEQNLVRLQEVVSVWIKLNCGPIRLRCHFFVWILWTWWWIKKLGQIKQKKRWKPKQLAGLLIVASNNIMFQCRGCSFCWL